MNNPGRKPARRGFTFIEVLLAATLLAALAGSLYACLDVSFRARRTAVAVTESARTLGLTMTLLEQDFRGAVVPNGILAGLFAGISEVGSGGLRSDSMEFYSAAPPSLARPGRGDIRMIQLLCEPDDSGKLALKRKVTTNLLSQPQAEPYEEVLCRNLRSFALRYFDGTDWLDDWDSTTNENVLPVAVEVKLEIEQPDDPQSGQKLLRVIEIPCGQDAAEAAGASGGVG
jgi:prepilin-type N-terminal cleavage/methylation domain-containing protein